MELPYAFVLNHVGEGNENSKQCNLSTLAVVRSLGRKKIPIVLATTNYRDQVIDSRFIKHVEVCPSLADSEQQLLDRYIEMAEKYTGPKVLIPTVDECAYFVGKYYQQLVKHFLIPAPNWSSIERINNKRFQYEACEALGIPIPETYFPKTIAEIQALADTIDNYPYVIKPNVSFEWKLKSASSGAKGKKGIRVDNAQQLVETATEIFQPEHEFMVQEVIGGRDENLVTLIGYFNQQSQPDSFFVRKKFRQNPIDFGYCTMTESCHDDTVKTQSFRLLKSLGYHGIGGVEWKLDPDTGKHKLIEINARPVNTTGCAIASGVDLPAIAYFDAIGKPMASVTEWKDGQRWVWFSMDFWAARQLIQEGNLSYWQWLKMIIKTKADAVFSWDDLPLSFQYYGKFTASLITGKFKQASKR